MSETNADNLTVTKSQLDKQAAKIRLVIFDVDGVMTDGRLYLGPDGAEFKSMHVRDGLGLKRLQAMDITPAVISGRPSRAVEDRLLELGLQYIYLHVEDKAAVFQELCEMLQLEPEQCAVMGDDLPDLTIMRRAGLAMSVADAVPDVKNAAHWVSSRCGGDGAVREACDLIIAAQESVT